MIHQTVSACKAESWAEKNKHLAVARLINQPLWHGTDHDTQLIVSLCCQGPAPGVSALLWWDDKRLCFHYLAGKSAFLLPDGEKHCVSAEYSSKMYAAIWEMVIILSFRQSIASRTQEEVVFLNFSFLLLLNGTETIETNFHRKGGNVSSTQ